MVTSYLAFEFPEDDDPDHEQSVQCNPEGRDPS